jgi:DNA-binding beta-propeller fold protein YncE
LRDGSYLVAEELPSRLLKVSSDGKTREVIASGLSLPAGLALAGKDEVYLTEAKAGNVEKINISTGVKKVVASGLIWPEGIAVQPDGKILVVEVGLKRLIEIDPDTGAIKPLVKDLAVGAKLHPDLMAKFPAGWLSDVEISDSGDIYVSGDLENVIYKIMRK